MEIYAIWFAESICNVLSTGGESVKWIREILRCPFDDFIIYIDSWEEHLQHLEIIIICLKQAGLILKLKKCEF